MKDIKILIVEDEVLSAIVMEKQLIKMGFRICERVTTGENAVYKAEEHNPDVIIMDIRLAGRIDGIEAVQKIYGSKIIPVIFLTGYPDEEIKRKASTLNPIGYFVKPTRIERIENAIRKHFQIN